MECARIMEEETEMNLTEQDLVKLGLTRKGKWQYTVADIEALPEYVRAELIDGELFVRMKTPETIHQDILMGLSFQMEPDITLICDNEKLKKQGCYGAPDFVIEIVSPSNRKMDYVRKLALYKEAGSGNTGSLTRNMSG